jgi:phosphoglycolate phosphatase-like HAD superfamily hydrolase
MGRLILWDIDGTLVWVGDVGEEAFALAIEGVLGARPSKRVPMSGKTDPQILHEYLAHLGIAGAEEHVEPILLRLETELATAKDLIRQRGKVMPGAEALLSKLGNDPGFLQSVLTGNIAPNAMVKLTAFGLDTWLDLEIGAYGSDHADRGQLVAVAMGRAERLRGIRFEPTQIWIIGDSAHDFACANAAGAHCLLVATGRASFDDLARLGADATLRDLSDVDAVLSLLRR